MSELHLIKDSLSAVASRLDAASQSASGKIKNAEAFSFYLQKIQNLTHELDNSVGEKVDVEVGKAMLSMNNAELTMSEKIQSLSHSVNADWLPNFAPPVAPSNMAETDAHPIDQLVSSIFQSQQFISPAPAPNLQAIPSEQQNVVNASLKSQFVYTANQHAPDNTLWQLQDGLRRATDTYDNAVLNAKSGYCSFVASGNGQPVYLSKGQQIELAKTNVEKAKAMVDEHTALLQNPVALAAREVAYQITHGKPSVAGPLLSERDQVLVRERRAGNVSTDGSIALIET